MIQPRKLKAGDAVALIAPARAVSRDEMHAFAEWCSQKNLMLKEGVHLYGRFHQFSGTAAERSQDLRNAWLDPEVKAVFCARGGYGSVHIANALSDEEYLSNPKWLVGFSDITTLHLKLNKLGLATLHAPMPIHWGKSNEFTAENIGNTEAALFHLKVEINLFNNLIYNNKSFKGNIIGGNLSLVYAALGTPEQPDTRGAVLFLEDLDEYLYHIDRMMMAMKRAGLLKELSALIVGGMTDMRDNSIAFGFTAQEIIYNSVQ
jgi:muramoyltetrapeptide carboxypeptidase